MTSVKTTTSPPPAEPATAPGDSIRVIFDKNDETPQFEQQKAGP